MNSKRIMDIEVLRAIAVLGVLFHHLQGSLFTDTVPLLQTVHHWAQSWWGVDLFFAISGFVIARSLIPALQGCTSRRQCWEQTRNFCCAGPFVCCPRPGCGWR